MEAIEELNALLPALEQYASDSYIAGVIKTAREKIAKAEANVPQAKVKFEAEPLKEQVNRVQGKLDVRRFFSLVQSPHESCVS
jgi:tRNA U54 and U55 pseudouridine synthase Pus10